ncbi:MAG TPA: polyphosphate kinase 1 [Thermoanaerobaculia bacterium]|nr:polyphosphate kinase 1 [Thermoanaerobaculia bacterium]
MIRHEQRPRRKRSREAIEEPLPAPFEPPDEPAPAELPAGPPGDVEERAEGGPSVPLLNRELSWLDFNQRVLEEARDERWPLLERLKFLCISESNLDEFFMIRVSGLRDQLSADLAELSDDGLTAREQLALVRKGVLAMEAEQTACLHEDLLPRLAAAGITLLVWGDLDEERREAARSYFRRNVLPVLTPLAVDPGHPFPFLSNLSVNLAIETRNPENGEVKFARVKMPPAIPRLLPLRTVVEGKKKVKATHAEFLLLEELVQANLDELFPGLEILASYLFRITRDADIEIQEDEASDLLATIEQEVRRRRFGAVVRVEVTPQTPKKMRKLLMRQLEVSESDIYEVVGILGAADLMALVKLDRRDLKDAPFAPALPPALAAPEGSIFQAIRQGDLLLHHPYDSFGPVVELIEEAADDPKTLAIKMTLYRTSSDSPVIPALVRAAEAGKQVAVLVELKARFDEENNIVWAKALERAGIHVVYGVVGLKTHAKIALVVRREKDEIRRYVHLGTGNYNPATAKVYTDLGLLTCRPEFGEDATRLFNTLTGLATRTSYNRIVTAPRDLHRTVLDWISRETEHARAGRPARIRAKLNALVDTAVIKALYDASRAGVPVDLIVRGTCCLVPGLPGVSGTVRVRSIVGRFLEHSRFFLFENGGDPEVWASSADWMPRNFFRRVETAFPIVDPELGRQLSDAFDAMMADNARARALRSDGTYERLRPGRGEPAIDSQAFFLDQARRRVLKAAEHFVKGAAADGFDRVPDPRERGPEDDGR